MIHINNITREDSPRDVLHRIFSSIDEMPIGGGWGYKKDEAVVIDKNDEIVPSSLPFNGVELEYTFIKYRTYLELITFRDKNDRFSGIEFELVKQELLKDEDGKVYDKLTMGITALRDSDFEELKEEWESSYFNSDFDHEIHERKKEEKFIHAERECWFEISSFYGQDLVMQSNTEKKKVHIENMALKLSDDEKQQYIKDDKLIEQFFVYDFMIEDFKTRNDMAVFSENGKWLATLTKAESTKWLYVLRLGNGKIYLGDYLRPFELTEENIEIFHKGVSAISHEFENYLVTGKYNESWHPFGKLAY